MAEGTFTGQSPLLTPGQQQTTGFARQQANQYVQNRGQGFNPEEIRNEYNRNFQSNIAPGIISQFNATGGGRNSSALRNSVTQAGQQSNAQLATLLAQLGIQQQGQNDIWNSNLLNQGLRPEFENVYEPNSFWGNLGSALPAAAAAYFSGGLSESGSLWNTLSKLLGGGDETKKTSNDPYYQTTGLVPPIQQNYNTPSSPQNQGWLGGQRFGGGTNSGLNLASFLPQLGQLAGGRF